MLAWPLQTITPGGHDGRGQAHYKFETTTGKAQATWHHITDPDEWEIIPYRWVRGKPGLVLEETGAPLPLPKAAVRNHRRVGYHGLYHLALHLRLEVSKDPLPARRELVELLACHLFEDDLGTRDEIIRTAADGDDDPVVLWADDPLFEIIDGMDEGEKRELSGPSKSVLMRNVRQAADRSTAARQAASPKAKAKARPKAKAKAKAPARADSDSDSDMDSDSDPDSENVPGDAPPAGDDADGVGQADTVQAVAEVAVDIIVLIGADEQCL